MHHARTPEDLAGWTPEAELGVPVKLIGIGEQATDLVTFDPRDFAAALIG